MQVFDATKLLCSVGRLKKFLVLLYQHVYLSGDVAGCFCIPGDQQNIHCRRDRIWTVYIVRRIETANNRDACTACRL